MRRKYADFYREVSPPDSLSSLSNGSPIAVSENPDGTSTHSALPNGDFARNIGRPSPDSPNLKYRNLDRAEANGRTPAEGQDFGYTHDSGSGSARVIPYDSGFTNNSSALRNAGIISPSPKDVALVHEAYLYLLHRHYIYKVGDFKEYEDSKNPFKEGSPYEEYYELEDLKRSEVKGFIESFERSLFLQIDKALGYVKPRSTSEHYILNGKSELARSLNEMKEKGFSKKSYVKGERALDKIIDPFYYFKEVHKEISNFPSFKKDWYIQKSRGLEISPKDLEGFSRPVNVSLFQGIGMGNYQFAQGFHKVTINTEVITEAYDTVRHELTHALQQEFNLRYKGEHGGLPSKTRSRYDQHNEKQEIQLKQIAEKKGLNPSRISLRYLDDVEFYTYFLDEVESYRSKKTHSNNRIREFIEDSNFFYSLKHFQRNKYNKAVGIFVSEVNKNNSSALRNAGLIRPPKHLVDKVSDILRAGYASYSVKKQNEIDKTPYLSLSLDKISDFEELIEILDEAYWATRGSTANFENLETALKDMSESTKEFLSEFERNDLPTPPDLEKVVRTLESINPNSVFKDPKSYRDQFSLLDRKSFALIPLFKELRREPVDYISDSSRRLYERESNKVKKFNSLLEPPSSSTWVLDTERFGATRLQIRESKNESEGLAYYRYDERDNTHTITVRVFPGATNLSHKELDSIKDYSRHELVHVIQKQMSLDLNVDQAGIPNSKRDMTYLQGHGYKEKELKEQYAKEGLDSEKVCIHALDDIEFYTRLLDEFVEFQRQNIDRSDLNQEVHNWVSNRRFFVSLKRFKRENWSKAVGIFFDAVNSDKSAVKVARKWSEEYCKKKDCKDMGFSEKASCRPYKNCYKGKTGSSRQDMISNLVSLIPPPPPIEDLLKELYHVMFQYENRFNSESEQEALDDYFWTLFDDVLVREGYETREEELKEISDSLVSLIYDLKDYYNTVRPDELASMKGISFRADFLKAAQTSSYPSGHTTQAFYLAYTLSEEFPLLSSEFFKIANKVAESRVDRGVHFFSDNEGGEALAKVLFDRKINKYGAKRDDSKLKNTGHGGLDTWFAGHGGGKPDERATWGDWIAITPIKHTIKKKNGEPKTYDAGDIVGLCAISSEPQWKRVTDDGKNPLKCMPRDKAYDLTKEQRATLARKKRREESKAKDGQKPVHTPTFSEKGKEMISKKSSGSPISFSIKGGDEENKLANFFAMAYSDSDQLKRLFEDSLDEIYDDILTDAANILNFRDSFSLDLRPFDISVRKWEKDYEKLNTQHRRYNPQKPKIWGSPPQANVADSETTFGGTFNVRMSGTDPHIIGQLKVFFNISYTIIEERRGPHMHRLIDKTHTFYSDVDIKLTLRNSRKLNDIYLMWLEGKFN